MGSWCTYLRDVRCMCSKSTHCIDVIITQDESPNDYCLVEVSHFQGMTEKMLADTDTPWKKFHDLRRVS